MNTLGSRAQVRLVAGRSLQECVCNSRERGVTSPRLRGEVEISVSEFRVRGLSAHSTVI